MSMASNVALSYFSIHALELRRIRQYFCIALFSLIPPAIASGITIAFRQQDESADRSIVPELIEQLGADDFQVRRIAERRLLEIGAPAIPHLKNARTIGDSEIRFQARRLLVRVLRADYQQRIEQFVASTDPQNSFGLNGWKEFSAIAGHDISARRLFVSMQRAEKDLFLSWSGQDDDFKKAVESVMSRIGKKSGSKMLPALACAMLVKTMENESFSNMDRSISRISPVEVDNYIGSQSFIGDRLDKDRMLRVIKAGTHEASFTRLIRSWLDSLPNAISSMRIKLRVINRHELQGYLDFAADSLDNKEIGAEVRAQTISFVARSRQPKYLEILEQLLSDESFIGEFQTGYKHSEKIRVQIRDLALAALVYISGQSYSDFGFVNYNGLDDQFIILSQAGFATQQQRDASIAKWRAFRNQLSDEQISGNKQE